MNRQTGFGAALGIAVLIGVSAAAAAQERLLYSFRNGRDGRSPLAGLIVDANGVLYGTTSNGGETDTGTVFALSPPAAGETRWIEKVLYSFRRRRDGGEPSAGLIADAKGVLYGTTTSGGDSFDGTVFALSPPAAGETRWTETVLYRFRGGRDGRLPFAGLIADANGVLYGTTSNGGDNDNGTVFALSPPAAGATRWTETVLHRFRGGPDGRFPFAGLIVDANGVLYGTTSAGGETDTGTVFALSPPAAGKTRWTHTVLHSFRGTPDGGEPFAGLIADAKGVLYGTTTSGGDSFNGTVFALSPPTAGETRWTKTVLYSFRGTPDGRLPFAGLIADAKGVLYGTTAYGGIKSRNDSGAVFALSPPAAGETRWTETVLYRFGVGLDGFGPFAGLIADAKDVLYGTTTYGGDNGNGTVFALSPPAAGETQ
jgi:uncharacterized repeat protein (TIGR03803 family)